MPNFLTIFEKFLIFGSFFYGRFGIFFGFFRVFLDFLGFFELCWDFLIFFGFSGTFWGKKKASAEGRSPPQELEVGLWQYLPSCVVNDWIGYIWDICWFIVANKFSVWPLPEVKNWFLKHIWNEKVHISILDFFWSVSVSIKKSEKMHFPLYFQNVIWPGGIHFFIEFFFWKSRTPQNVHKYWW